MLFALIKALISFFLPLKKRLWHLFKLVIRLVGLILRLFIKNFNRLAMIYIKLKAFKIVINLIQ